MYLGLSQKIGRGQNERMVWIQNYIAQWTKETRQKVSDLKCFMLPQKLLYIDAFSVKR